MSGIVQSAKSPQEVRKRPTPINGLKGKTAGQSTCAGYGQPGSTTLATFRFNV
jgi:hypothetical protein